MKNPRLRNEVLWSIEDDIVRVRGKEYPVIKEEEKEVHEEIETVILTLGPNLFISGARTRDIGFDAKVFTNKRDAANHARSAASRLDKKIPYYNPTSHKSRSKRKSRKGSSILIPVVIMASLIWLAKKTG